MFIRLTSLSECCRVCAIVKHILSHIHIHKPPKWNQHTHIKKHTCLHTCDTHILAWTNIYIYIYRFDATIKHVSNNPPHTHKLKISVPLQVWAGVSISPHGWLRRDFRPAHGTRLFPVKPDGNTLFTEYMLATRKWEIRITRKKTSVLKNTRKKV